MSWSDHLAERKMFTEPAELHTTDQEEISERSLLELQNTGMCRRDICYIILAIFVGGLALLTLTILIFNSNSIGEYTSQFIYVNDMHIDILYDPTSDKTNDSSGNCRRPYNASVKPYKFGQYGCDSPNTTVTSAFKAMGKFVENPKFILFGGDGIAHGTHTREEIQSNFRFILDGLNEQFPKVPVLITVGNNDFVPNYGNPENETLDFRNIGDLFHEYGYMTDVQLDTFLTGGYYYWDDPSEKMRLLLLNTVLYSQLREVGEDPRGQFAWIRSVCSDARAKGYKIGVAMHIFPGVSHWGSTQGWHDVYVQKFEKICKEFDVRFTLVAHCHYDMILPVYGNEGTSMGYSLSSPSISTAHKNNPAFRVMKYRDGEIADILQYYADIMMNPDELNWKLEYRFTDAYDVADLSKDNVLKVIKWVTETGEGMWRYKEKVCAMASDNGKFYYCILKATTVEQVKECMGSLAASRKSLSPYDDEM